MAIPETMAERVKAALRGADLSVKGLAEAWGVDRSGLSDRIHQGRLAEDEVVRIAAATGTTPAYLRYGIRGGYGDGMLRAVRQMTDALAAITTGARAEGATLPVDAPSERETPTPPRREMPRAVTRDRSASRRARRGPDAKEG